MTHSPLKLVEYISCFQMIIDPARCNMQCLQYQTDQLADVKKVEKLNNFYFASMARGDISPGQSNCCLLLLIWEMHVCTARRLKTQFLG